MIKPQVPTHLFSVMKNNGKEGKPRQKWCPSCWRAAIDFTLYYCEIWQKFKTWTVQKMNEKVREETNERKRERKNISEASILR